MPRDLHPTHTPTPIHTQSITATTQKSRFHAETVDESSRDINLKSLHLTIDDVELLSDARLQLRAGRRYGLVGRNGVGKSTLLRALGRGLVVGLPSRLRALYVDQLEGADAGRSATALVVAADEGAERAAEESEALAGALGTGNAGDCACALRALRLRRLEGEVEQRRQVAERRSRLRGRDAREELVAAEGRLAQARAVLDAPVDAAELAAARHDAQEELAALFDALAIVRTPEEVEAEARAILKVRECRSLGCTASHALQVTCATMLHPRRAFWA